MEQFLLFCDHSVQQCNEYYLLNSTLWLHNGHLRGKQRSPVFSSNTEKMKKW